MSTGERLDGDPDTATWDQQNRQLREQVPTRTASADLSILNAQLDALIQHHQPHSPTDPDERPAP